MTTKWVGMLFAITFILMAVGTAVSAPSGTQEDKFETPDDGRWTLVRGNLSHKEEIGWANDWLSWMVLGDDNDSAGLDTSRVIVDASHLTDGEPTWNTTSASYVYSATLVQNDSYVPPASLATPATGGPATNTTSGSWSTLTGGATSTSGAIPAAITASVTEGLAPLTVSFGLASSHVDAATLDWQVDAENDGTFDSSGTGLPDTTTLGYTTPGTYDARLRVNNTTNAGNAYIQIVVLREIASDITANATTGTIPATVDFTLDSAEADAASLTWTLDADGDGTTDASGTGLPATPSFTYTAAGAYTAKYSVSDGTHTSNATLDLGFTKPTLDGMLGITFGEQPGAGYYVAAFEPGRFILGIPDAATGEFDILVDQPHWGSVAPEHTDMTDRHKYSVEVDATTVQVKVDNALVGSYVLPGNPVGAFGIIAGDDQEVKVGEVYWRALDRIAPEIDLFRPEAGSIYVADRQVPYGIADPIFVFGELTIVADITDEGLGADCAELRIDGKFKQALHGVGIDTQASVDTSGLSAGYHTITLRVFDYAGNYAEESVTIFVLSAIPGGATIGDTADVTETVVDDVLNDLPGVP